MMALDEDGMVCDLAETYGIYNYLEYPPALIATLASGLPDDSRIKRKASGSMLGTRDMLLAAILDRVDILIWMQTEDGAKGINRPSSVLEKLVQQGKGNSDIECFDSAEAYEAWHQGTMEGK